MGLLLRLITPDPSKGDRPFEDRPYGRLRLTQPLAVRLQEMVEDEIEYLRNERRLRKEKELDLHDIDTLLKETRKIGDLLQGLAVEKQWDLG